MKLKRGTVFISPQNIMICLFSFQYQHLFLSLTNRSVINTNHESEEQRTICADAQRQSSEDS